MEIIENLTKGSPFLMEIMASYNPKILTLTPPIISS